MKYEGDCWGAEDCDDCLFWAKVMRGMWVGAAALIAAMILWQWVTS